VSSYRATINAMFVLKEALFLEGRETGRGRKEESLSLEFPISSVLLGILTSRWVDAPSLLDAKQQIISDRFTKETKHRERRHEAEKAPCLPTTGRGASNFLPKKGLRG